MTLTHILVFSMGALACSWLVPRAWRGWFLLAASLVAAYWLQPSTALRNLDFWLPSASIALTCLVWSVTRTQKTGDRRAILTATLAISVIMVLIGLTRYTGSLCCLTASRPPDIARVLLFIGIALALCAIPFLLPNLRYLSTLTILLILALFLTLKTETLAQKASQLLRTATGQTTELASALDLPWLGFSFLAFRLLHVLRDYQTGKLPSYSLSEFVTYAIFFPTYTAGPIDRSQRFMGDLRKVVSPALEDNPSRVNTTNLYRGGQRILWGMFKKFVIADSLALIALNGQNASQVNSTFWAWVLLYAYALRIYFDFAGYTDVAVGIGRLVGFNLPENFDRPYLKQNLTAFWNSWHMTLAQWFRAYYFNPLIRFLRTRSRQLPAWLVILIGQFTTMALIGLWHGITWNFFIWGAWHGIGLFLHNRWQELVRLRQSDIEIQPFLVQRVLQVGGWFLTFQFVTIGWVWFALPNPAMAREVLLKLFGF